MDKGLQKYVLDALSNGYSESEIQSKLVQSGYSIVESYEAVKALKKKPKELQTRIREVIELQKEQHRIRWRIRGLTTRLSDKTKWMIDRMTGIESLQEGRSK